MFYTVYKITNLVNNKIYVGVHKTSDLSDDYMGSGKLIKRAIEKYGIENFEKEYIEIFDNSEDMFNMESQLVNEEFVSRDDTYNLKQDGFGGFDHINKEGNPYWSSEHTRMMSIKGKDKALKTLKYLWENDKEWVKAITLKRLETRFNKYGLDTFKTFSGKTHTDESKKQMSISHKGKHDGQKNSQFGTMWIHSLTEKVSKKIKQDDFSTYEQQGWLKGRKMKF